MEKIQDFIEETVGYILEGYSVKDGYFLMVHKNSTPVNNLKNTANKDLLKIYHQAGFIASKIILDKEENGTLIRETKELPAHLKKKTRKKHPAGVFYNPYSKRMTFKERVLSKWKEVDYQTNNPTRTVRILMKYFNLKEVDMTDTRLQTLLEVMDEMKNDA